MKRILGVIGLLVIFGGGFYYYSDYRKTLQDPLERYQTITTLPLAQQAQAYKKTVDAWIDDPLSQITYPKGWQKTTMTIKGASFEIVTSDTVQPPRYYVSFAFPKKLISQMTVIKCLGVTPDAPTDVCIIGDNPAIDAYVSITQWMKQVGEKQSQLVESMTPSIVEE